MAHEFTSRPDYSSLLRSNAQYITCNCDATSLSFRVPKKNRLWWAGGYWQWPCVLHQHHSQSSGTVHVWRVLQAGRQGAEDLQTLWCLVQLATKVRSRTWVTVVTFKPSDVLRYGNTFQRLALYYVCIGSSCQMIALPTQHFLEWCCIWFLVWSGIATHAEIGHRSLYPVRPLQDCRISDIFTNVTVATHSLSVEETSYQCI